MKKGGITEVVDWNRKKNGELYGKQTVKNAPLRWKSAPDHPETHLAYVTDLEAKLLKQLDLHNSGVRYEDHFGPMGIPSYNGAGAGDSDGGATAGGETGGPGAGGGSGNDGTSASDSSGTGGSENGGQSDAGGQSESPGGGLGDGTGGGDSGTSGIGDAAAAEAAAAAAAVDAAAAATAAQAQENAQAQDAEAAAAAANANTGLYGPGDQGFGNFGGFGSFGTVGPDTGSFGGSIGTQGLGVGGGLGGLGGVSTASGPSSAGFGVNGVTEGAPSANVSNAMDGLGLGVTSGAGFGLSGVVGTGQNLGDDPSGVANGLTNAITAADFNSMNFGPPASPAAIGLTTAVPGFAMTQQAQQMATPSPMSINPTVQDPFGNPSIATSLGVMGPTGMNSLAGFSAFGNGLSALGVGGPSVSGGFGLAYGPSIDSMVSGPVSAPTAVASTPAVSAPTAVAAAPSVAAPVSAPTTAAPAPSQVAAAPAPATPTTSFFDDPLGAVTEKFSQAMNNPVATVGNVAVGMFGGPIGLANTVSGMLGGPTIGGGLQSLADAIASGNFGNTNLGDVNMDVAASGSDSGGQPLYSYGNSQTPIVPTAPTNTGVQYNLAQFTSPGGITTLPGATPYLQTQPYNPPEDQLMYAGPFSQMAQNAFRPGTYSFTPSA